MKKLMLGAICLSAMMLCGCNEKKDEVRDFAIHFAEKVKANQMDSVAILYPDAKGIEAMSIGYIPDSIAISEDGAGEYTVSYASGVKMKMKKNAGGTMTVNETYGMASFPTEELKFAQQTGMLDGDINDAELARRMADANFIPWLRDRFIKYRAKNLKVKGGMKVIKDIVYMMDTGIIGADVANTTDRKIDGEDYKVVFKYRYVGMGGENVFKVEKPGKDIEPGQTVTITTEFTGHEFPEKAYVDTQLSSDELFKKYFTPKGTEYREYLASKTH